MIITVFILFFSIFLLVNLGINNLFKKNRKIFFYALHNKNYIEIKKNKTETFSKHLLTVNWGIYCSKLFYLKTAYLFY